YSRRPAPCPRRRRRWHRSPRRRCRARREWLRPHPEERVTRVWLRPHPEERAPPRCGFHKVRRARVSKDGGGLMLRDASQRSSARSAIKPLCAAMLLSMRPSESVPSGDSPTPGRAVVVRETERPEARGHLGEPADRRDLFERHPVGDELLLDEG